MRPKLIVDLSLNILMPLLLGLYIYYLAQINQVSSVVRNYVPDALWAFAFTSTMLIIWNRVIPQVWIFVSSIIPVLFELFQFLKVIPGRGDIMDVIVCITSVFLSLSFNNFFKRAFYEYF